MDGTLGTLIDFVINTIDKFGYLGIFGGMFAQGVGFPLPSEITMMFSGFLSARGDFFLPLVILAGVLGDVAGALLVYSIFRHGGRPLLKKYGKYFLVHEEDIKKAEVWFHKHGALTLFFGKMLPVIRGFIIYPAAIGKMNFKKYVTFDAAGSLVWCTGLAYLGVKLEKNWTKVGIYFDKFKIVVAVLLILALIWYIRRHLMRKHV